MKKFFAGFLSVLLIVCCLYIPAIAEDPTPTEVKTWSYVNDFNEMPSSGIVFKKANKECTAADIGATVGDGNLTVANSEAVEYLVALTDEAIAKCDSYIFEIYFKVECEDSASPVISLFNYMGNGFRIHSQVGVNVIKLRDPGGNWKNAEINLIDGSYHTLRYEVNIANGASACNIFADGNFVMSGEMQANNGPASIQFINKSAAGKKTDLVVDYIKAVKVEKEAPKQHVIDEWSFCETFHKDIDSLSSGTWSFGTAEGRTAVVEDGKLVIKNSAKGEMIVGVTADSIAKTSSYALEIKMKADFTETAGSRISVLSFMGEGWRIHSQIKEEVVSLQNPAGAASTWASGKFVNNDGEYHVYRYEVTIGESSAVCDVFVDGEYLFSGAMNANNGAALHRLVINTPADGETAALSVDYIRSAAVKDFSALETGSQPDPVDPPETEPETKPETEPETKPETEPETKPETEPETKPEPAPEDPEQHIINDWSYSETFDRSLSSLTSSGWEIPSSAAKTAAVKGGSLILTNSEKGEFVVSLTNPSVSKQTSFALEIKMKAEFTETAGSRISVLSFMGDGWRIHSQIKENVVSLQNPAGAESTWSTGSFVSNDGEYHVYRYEVSIANGVATCHVFVDGEYLFSGAMNNNNGAPLHKFVLYSPADGETASLYIDYIRSTAVSDFSSLPTGEQPEPETGAEEVPDTADGVLAAIIAGGAAASVLPSVLKSGESGIIKSISSFVNRVSDVIASSVRFIANNLKKLF